MILINLQNLTDTTPFMLSDPVKGATQSRCAPIAPSLAFQASKRVLGEHLRRIKSASKRLSVMLCCIFSSRNSVDGVIPVFLANCAYVISPRAFFRKMANL